MTTRKTYHPLSVSLHWLIFILFVVALAAIEFREDIPKGEPLRDILKTVHMHAGQLVFLFVIVRVLARWRFGAPEELQASQWQRLGATSVHLALYFVMFALPISGILFTQAGGRDVVFFGMTLPQFIAENQDIRGPIKEFHEFLGNAVYYLVGVHIAAALWHQFVLRDRILQRMRWHKDN